MFTEKRIITIVNHYCGAAFFVKAHNSIFRTSTFELEKHAQAFVNVRKRVSVGLSCNNIGNQT